MSKEEIEKAKEQLNKFCNYDDNLFLQDEILYEYQDSIETLLQYINQLEQENSKKDKIIDEVIKTWKQDDYRDIEEIKEYFEKKIRKG